MTPTIPQIRCARALLDWGQTDLARHVGMSQTAIARLENGTTSPGSPTLEKIKAAFEKNGICFMGDSGVKREPNLKDAIAKLEEAVGTTDFSLVHDAIEILKMKVSA